MSQPPSGDQPYGAPSPYEAVPPTSAPGSYQPPVGYQQAPAGMYWNAQAGVMLPEGVALASVGRRIGAYFLAIPLFIVTLGIGYLIWGLVQWNRGSSPALSVLGMKCWHPESGRPASFWRMVLRDILGRLVDGILSFITELVSFIMFLSSNDHKSLHDAIASTVVVHDPNGVLSRR